MQTPAEAHLIRRLCDYLLKPGSGDGVPLILNIGAGRSVEIENRLAGSGCRFVSDRIDVEDCTVDSPHVRTSWRCSVENMEPLRAGQYDAAFANYVLEHVEAPGKAAAEIFRVLKPGGIFVTTVPNLTAPEFVLARHAPERFQHLMTQGKGFHTCYAWGTIGDLADLFKANGFAVDEVRFWAFTESYLGRYPVIGLLSRLYDRLVSSTGIRRLMGNVCITLTKAAPAGPCPEE